MEIDVSGILFGGLSALVLLIFLTQTARESFNLESRFIPVSALLIALVMMIMAAYLPEKLVQAIAAGIGIAAVASFTIRYTKNGQSDDERNARSAAERLQRDHDAPSGVSRTRWTFPETTFDTERYSDLRGVRPQKQYSVDQD